MSGIDLSELQCHILQMSLERHFTFSSRTVIRRKLLVESVSRIALMHYLTVVAKQNPNPDQHLSLFR